MNLQSKDEFIRDCFEVYEQIGNGFPPDITGAVDKIEEMMGERNIDYLKKERVTTNTQGTITETGARDEFIASLTEDNIRNKQHMKIILNSHLDFLNANW